MEAYKLLEEKLGKKSANKIVRMLNKFEKEAVKVRSEINTLLSPMNHELQIGLKFTEKSSGD